MCRPCTGDFEFSKAFPVCGLCTGNFEFSKDPPCVGPVLGTLSFFEKNPYEGVGCGDLSSSIAPKKKERKQKNVVTVIVKLLDPPSITGFRLVSSVFYLTSFFRFPQGHPYVNFLIWRFSEIFPMM